MLLYPRIQFRYRITPDEAIRFTGNLAQAAHLVEPIIVIPLVEADPADDAVLYTAADGRAEILAHEISAIFSSPAAKAFCHEHAIRVMTDVDLLRELFAAPKT